MKTTLFVMWLVVAVVLGGVIGGAFVGGVALGKSQGKEEATQALQSRVSSLGSSAGQRSSQQGTTPPGTTPSGTTAQGSQQGTTPQGSSLPGGMGAMLGRGGTVGTVEKVEGNVLTLATRDGATVRVVVGDKTVIQKMGQGSLGDILAGGTITATGERQGDGSIQATSIFITPNVGAQ